MNDDEIQQIAKYIRSNMPVEDTTKVYAYKRPANTNSVTITISDSGEANSKMWSQEFFISVEVYKKESPQASFVLSKHIRDLMLNAQGVLQIGGVRFLSFYAMNTLPVVLDIAQDNSDIYGTVFRVKYIDNSVPI